MKLFDAVMAWTAAEELGGEAQPYPLALALVLLKERLREPVEFFLAQERKLVEEYGQLDGDGRVRLTERGMLVTRGPEELEAYTRKRLELGETELPPMGEKLQAPAPEAIKPCHLAALGKWIEFT